jgi:hypothetical protein
MWAIFYIVTAVAYNGHPHTISSNAHFLTEAACIAAIPADTELLFKDLADIGILPDSGTIRGSCQIDEDGNPA